MTASVHCQVAAVLEHLAAKLASVTAAAVLGARPAVPAATVRSAGPAAGAAASRGGSLPVQLAGRGGEAQAAVLRRVLG